MRSNFTPDLRNKFTSIKIKDIYYICDDFNSKCGDASNYIEVVDDVRERDVIDFTSNHYGDLFLDCLIDCNFVCEMDESKEKMISHMCVIVVGQLLVMCWWRMNNYVTLGR